MKTIQIPEQYSSLQITGYLIAVNLPATIRPPRVKASGVPLGRFDIVGYVGEFPEPLNSRYLHALQEGDKGVFYIRELNKAETQFAPRAYEYSLGIPTPEGQSHGLRACVQHRGTAYPYLRRQTRDQSSTIHTLSNSHVHNTPPRDSRQTSL